MRIDQSSKRIVTLAIASVLPYLIEVNNNMMLSVESISTQHAKGSNSVCAI